MSGFVYMWRDRKHNRYYIGKHWGLEDDGYICSSTWMMQAYRKRPQDFKRRILERVTTSRIDLVLAENRWLEKIREEKIRTRYYNLKRGNQFQWHDDPNRSLNIREKISLSQKGKKRQPLSEETREKIRIANTGKKRTLESIEKQKQQLVGKPQTQENIEKRRQGNLGKVREYVVCPNCGKSCSKSLAMRWHFDNCGIKVHMTEEQRQRMSEAHKGIIPNNGKTTIGMQWINNGIEETLIMRGSTIPSEWNPGRLYRTRNR